MVSMDSIYNNKPSKAPNKKKIIISIVVAIVIILIVIVSISFISDWIWASKLQKAVENEDLSYCEDLKKGKDICITLIAVQKKNHMLCLNLTDEGEQNVCMMTNAILTERLNVCDKFRENQTLISTCYIKYAERHDDPHACMTLKRKTSNDSLFDECMVMFEDRFYFESGILKRKE